MRRILFVDDEQHVLDGLRASLRRRRREWDMTFALGGEVGAAKLEAESFDVLVTDMRMSKVDGAALLGIARNLHPEMIRIVLSGFSEQEAILRTLPVAHQFLSKPCEAAKLENTIERACNVQQILDNPEVKAKIGSSDSLPVLSRNYHALNQALADEFVSVSRVAGIIETDIAMSAKLLQIVNSAFFGLSRRLKSVADAINYLGLHLIKNLALSIEVFGNFREQKLAEVISLEALSNHSLLAARIANHLIDDRDVAKDAFAAAVLHDVGKLVLAAHLPEVITQSVEHAETHGVPLHVAEKELGNVGHAEVGAYLLGRWGLPYPLIEAVAFHHAPGSVSHDTFDLLSAVHVANALAEEFAPTPQRGEVPYMDLEYLERLGVTEKLPGWRELAEREAGAADPSGS
jgi:HD-like signal output (HDOD) protein